MPQPSRRSKETHRVPKLRGDMADASLEDDTCLHAFLPSRVSVRGGRYLPLRRLPSHTDVGDVPVS
eukprot:CAMPEP_0195075128 /NCGR_PEP_ID=MMETSP0448-20130528/18074_1 /TAXON_ID=66468 /ORGANISM="Heterocapsa triquestra, Strain CCMP 448" /LENGTH=65 /DNA_ID=CAMNT_0040107473 /DNA_START=55 /DNA_END=249 /DNA_ORIENTATION=-